MYNGRHCVENDYYIVNNLIVRFFTYINKKDLKAISYGLSIVDEIANYDSDIANKFLLVLKETERSHDLNMLNKKSRPLLEELISNIIIDIKEHN